MRGWPNIFPKCGHIRKPASNKHSSQVYAFIKLILTSSYLRINRKSCIENGQNGALLLHMQWRKVSFIKHLLGILTLREQVVREHLTGGFLRDVSHKSSVPYQFLETGMSRTARRSQDWGQRMRHMHESPSVNILLGTKLLSLYPLSWDMDCLLSLWPLLIPRSLDKGCCMFGFLIFIIVERNSLCNSLYTLTERSLKHRCSTRGLGPRVFLSLSLFLPLANSLQC